MALVGRALLGLNTPPPPPGSGATAFSNWIALNNGTGGSGGSGGGGGPTATSGTTSNDSSGAHPGVIADAAAQATPQQTTGAPKMGSDAAAAAGTASPNLTSPTGQKQTLGS
jgi:hypothetical protein